MTYVHDFLRCSFCGKGQKQVKKLIAGSAVYICDGCVDAAYGAVATGQSGSFAAVAPDAGLVKCSFCDKPRALVPGLAAAAGGTICSECLDLCREIVIEEVP